MRTLLGHNADANAFSPSPTPDPQSTSPWHSPIPYLFGGLAATLGLIAFALLILACSCWRVSGGQEDGDGGRDSGQEESSLYMEKPVWVLEQKVVVIMAGELMPTYVATPVYAKGANCGEPAKGNDDGVGENARQGGGCTASDHNDKEGFRPIPIWSLT